VETERVKTCGFEVGGGYHGVVFAFGNDLKGGMNLWETQLTEDDVNPEIE